MKRNLSGVDQTDESSLNLEKDLTPTPIKIARFIKSEGFWIILIFFNLIPFIVSDLAFIIEINMFFSYILYRMNYKAKETLPFKKPESSFDKYDDNEINPGNDKSDKPQGITFFGNELKTKKEIWFTNSDIRTHALIFGTTGAGKTEALLSICVNTLNQASGIIYIDGKGDNSLWAKVFSLVAARGRLDDLYLVNYMTSSLNKNVKSVKKISNTINPFATGNSDSLSELIVSLLPDSGGDGMWKGRASIFMSSLLRPLVYLRDQGKILLDINVIRKYFVLDKVIELSRREDIPEAEIDGLREYVVNLPGYVSPTPSALNPKQPEAVGEQHGFITMQYTETFGLLSDTYGHIMKTQVAEVDFFDIVVNRRILVVLLPALEKSTQNLGNLGRIIIASIKNMMATTLGSEVEGDRRDVIDTKPTNAKSPYLTIFDEYGYYSVEGASVMPAQARSLGFFMIFAGQDFQAFKKGSEPESHSIVANCAIKLCMKLEDPGETLKIFQDAAGEDKVSELTSFERDSNSMSSDKYMASANINVTSKNIINVKDLRNQNPGEAHILFRAKTKRLKIFYANPAPLSYTRVNTFLEVEPPSYQTVRELKYSQKIIENQFDSLLENPKTYDNSVKTSISAIGSSELDTILRIMKISKPLNTVVRGVFTVISYIERVNIIDNEIVLKIKDNLKELKNSQKTEEESYSDDLDDDDDENLFTSENDSFDKNNSVNQSFDQHLKSSISKKQKALSSIEENTISVFDSIGIDFFDIQERLSYMENVISPDMVNKGMSENNNKSNNESNNLIVENNLLDVNINALPLKNSNKEDDKNTDDEIKNIIDSIIVDDIEDL